jgi:hypothetical protein
VHILLASVLIFVLIAPVQVQSQELNKHGTYHIQPTNYSGSAAGGYSWHHLDHTDKVHHGWYWSYNNIIPELEDARYTWTPYEERSVTKDDQHYKFQIENDEWVLVGWPESNTNFPDWLKSWGDTGLIQSASNSSYKLYAKLFRQGTVTLGAAEGANLMYVVILWPNEIAPLQIPAPPVLSIF